MKNVVFIFVCFFILAFAKSLSKDFMIQEQKSKLGFIENKGQIKYTNGKTADDILYIFPGNGIKIYIRKNSLSYELFSKIESCEETTITKNRKNVRPALDIVKDKSEFKSHRVDVDFWNSNPEPKVIAEDCYDESYNFYNTGGKEILNVKKFGKLTIKDLYQGIDVVFYSGKKQLLSDENG